jgi:putative FmdB family regulatory protein
MPTYVYKCQACGYEFEEFQSMSADPITLCPECNEDRAIRMMAGGSGLIFKGSGFYITDYKNKKSSGSTPEKKTTKPTE